jgi:hypothetical protein
VEGNARHDIEFGILAANAIKPTRSGGFQPSTKNKRRSGERRSLGSRCAQR